MKLLKKIKLLTCYVLVFCMLGSLVACSDDEDSEDKENKKEITRESKMKNNKDIDIFDYELDDEGIYHYYGVDGKGELVEIKGNFRSMDDFYKGFAIAKVSGGKYQLIDKKTNVAFEADDMDRSKDGLIIFENENDKQGVIDYEGNVLIEAKYEDIEVYEYEEMNDSFYTEYSAIVIKCDLEDGTMDYYNSKGKFLFNGKQSGYYIANNFLSEGFGVVGDPEVEGYEYYSYRTGKKFEGRVNFRGPVDINGDNFVLYDKDYNVIKEIPKKTEEIEYDFALASKERFLLEHYGGTNKKPNTYDVFSNKTGELLYSIEAQYVRDAYDMDNNEYLVYLVKTEKGKKVEVMDSKGKVVFSLEDENIKDVYTDTYNFFRISDGKNYDIYTLDGMKKVSSVQYNNYWYEDDMEEGCPYAYLNDEKTKCLYINDGKYKEFDIAIEGEKSVSIYAFVIYDYLVLQGNDMQYLIDTETGKVTYKRENISSYVSDTVPMIEISDEAYDFNGKLIYSPKKDK